LGSASSICRPLDVNYFLHGLITIETNPDLEEEEREFLMSLSPAYLEWEKQTLDQGKKEGKKEEKQAIALNLLKIGMNVEQVAQLTGLSVEKVKKLNS
jgi:predicted transposase/invertase (TIGR01784 family)